MDAANLYFAIAINYENSFDAKKVFAFSIAKRLEKKNHSVCTAFNANVNDERYPVAKREEENVEVYESITLVCWKTSRSYA